MDMSGFRMIPAGMGLMMPALAPWRPIEFVFVFVMWTVMMVGMMTPSAAPMILLTHALDGRRRPTANPSRQLHGLRLAICWPGLCLRWPPSQWASSGTLLTPMMESKSNIFGGVVLITAGLYQCTPFKVVCLRQCQAPLLFIQNHGCFRRDVVGSLTLGAQHGAYCVGCCWVLMALLFVSGVMNALWIALIASFVLVEKIIPVGRFISRIAGVGFVLMGTWLIAVGFYTE